MKLSLKKTIMLCFNFVAFSMFGCYFTFAAITHLVNFVYASILILMLWGMGYLLLDRVKVDDVVVVGTKGEIKQEVVTDKKLVK